MLIVYVNTQPKIWLSATDSCVAIVCFNVFESFSVGGSDATKLIYTLALTALTAVGAGVMVGLKVGWTFGAAEFPVQRHMMLGSIE